MNLARMLKNWWYHTSGFGRCARCGDSWAWKKTGGVQYSASGSMFPVCMECQDELEPQELYHYCEKLVHSWEEFNPGENRESILHGVRDTLGIEVKNPDHESHA